MIKLFNHTNRCSEIFVLRLRGSRSWNILGYRKYSTNDKDANDKDANEKLTKDQFWEVFYHKLKEEFHSINSDSTNVSQYQHSVFEMLDKYKNDPNNLNKDKITIEKELYHLQESIENLTTQFDDLTSIYHSIPELLNKLISRDLICAKDYIKKIAEIDSSNKRRRCCLSSEELNIISSFDHYALEAIIIYVLGNLFHSLLEAPVVRTATLVNQLDLYVKYQAELLKKRKIALSNSSKLNTSNLPNNTDNNKEVIATEVKMLASDKKMQATENKSSKSSIGVLLLEFLIERGVIVLTNELNFNENDEIYKTKGGQYYKKIKKYAICNFNIGILPIKLNLPMVCKPLDWKPIRKGVIPKTLSDLRGGYLCQPMGNIYYYNRYSLLTTHDLNHFHIVLDHNCEGICGSMNMLQAQGFEINNQVLTFIKKNNDLLIKNGLLMPKHLASLNTYKATVLLRDYYLEVQSLLANLKYNDLLNEFMVNMQRARYENFIINLAYDGYRFYLPAFLDFRGRIYRSGVLHFHERDLARSLIVFSSDNSYSELDCHKQDKVDMILTSSAAFHFKKFHSYDDARQWYLKQPMKSSDERLIHLAVQASDPYQFISKVICIEGGMSNAMKIPITQDASASAYQLMSLFLLDYEIAEHTNLIPSENRINDIYTLFLDKLKSYILNSKDISSNLLDLILSRLTRKLMKRIFMPLIYGKTLISISNDIFQHYHPLLLKNESNLIAKQIYIYFHETFPGILNLMKLISNVGWVSAALDKPVIYGVLNLFTTVQDYMKTKTQNISIYDRIHKKRHKITLRIPIKGRDRRKTTSATFANFIHQKDAYIAMLMINFYKYPIYTVHDNFITTALYIKDISDIYIKIISSSTIFNPLYIINLFLYRNLTNNNILEGEISDKLFKPIPSHKLIKMLNNIIPIKYRRHSNEDNDETQIYKTYPECWNQRASNIYNSYTYYVNSICKKKYMLDNINESDYNVYIENLDKFQNMTSEWKYHNTNYSLHL